MTQSSATSGHSFGLLVLSARYHGAAVLLIVLLLYQEQRQPDSAVISEMVLGDIDRLSPHQWSHSNLLAILDLQS